MKDKEMIIHLLKNYSTLLQKHYYEGSSDVTPSEWYDAQSIISALSAQIEADTAKEMNCDNLVKVGKRILKEAKKGFRPALKYPIIQDGYAYITDSYRVLKMPEYLAKFFEKNPEADNAPNMENLYKNLSANTELIIDIPLLKEAVAIAKSESDRKHKMKAVYRTPSGQIIDCQYLLDGAMVCNSDTLLYSDGQPMTLAQFKNEDKDLHYLVCPFNPKCIDPSVFDENDIGIIEG